MLDSKSLSKRFIISLASNLVRSMMAFVSGLLVARGLSPSGYGNVTFLLSSFVAVRSLLDMGSSSAFYTFISQKNRCKGFYRAYLVWLSIQFFVPLLIVWLLLPDFFVAQIWVGQSRFMVLLAFVASFMQQQVWLTVNQIGEASRKTVRVQILGMSVALIHLVATIILLYAELLSVSCLLWLIVGEYALITVWSLWFLQNIDIARSVENVPTLTYRKIFDEYGKYCRPLLILSWCAFLYEFTDRWLLQYFGGASQQGFYQIASQFSAISLLATTSILNVFWKEIAEAHEQGDSERLAYIYQRVNQGLVMLGAVLSGFLMPWSKEIVRIFLGNSYEMAIPVLMLMFLYPIHQSMGQIGGTMLLASGHTNVYTRISAAMMLISLPLTYIVQAPSSGSVLPGFGLGAAGVAVKMVILNIISVNIQAWYIARIRKWHYKWIYQVVGIVSVIAAGFAAKFSVNLLFEMTGLSRIKGIVPFVSATLLYMVVIGYIFWMMPWLIGTTNAELKETFNKFKMLKIGI